MHTKRKNLLFAILLSLVLLALIFIGILLLRQGWKPKETFVSGLTKEHKSLLRTRYGITLPEDAELVTGRERDAGFRSPETVELVFRIPFEGNDPESLAEALSLSSEWEVCADVNQYGGVGTDLWNKTPAGCFSYLREEQNDWNFTHIKYIVKSGTAEIYFCGCNP